MCPQHPTAGKQPVPSKAAQKAAAPPTHRLSAACSQPEAQTPQPDGAGRAAQLSPAGERRLGARPGAAAGRHRAQGRGQLRMAEAKRRAAAARSWAPPGGAPGEREARLPAPPGRGAGTADPAGDFTANTSRGRKPRPPPLPERRSAAGPPVPGSPGTPAQGEAAGPEGRRRPNGAPASPPPLPAGRGSPRCPRRGSRRSARRP